MSEILEERIRRHAAGPASGYYLELHQKDGSVIRYPKVGAFSLKPFCRPSGTPFGTYNLFFVRYPSDSEPLPSANAAEPYPRVQIPFTKKSDLDRALSEFRTPEDANSATPEEADTEDVTDEEGPSATTRIADLEIAIASTPAMITARADFEKQRMAMELAENNQELLNRGNFSRDAAEALALNRAYRRESQVTIESHSHLIRRTAEEVQSHWVAFRTAQDAQIHGLRLIKEQLEMFARPAPPPPLPDYTPAIVEGLKTLRDFGVAMIQAKAGVPAAVAGSPSTVLPQQSTAARLVADEPPEKTGAESAKQEPKADARAVVSDAAAHTGTASPQSIEERSPLEETGTSAGPQDAEDEVAAGWTSLLDQLPSEDAEPPAVKPVAPLAFPSAPTVRGVLNSAQTQEAREEAAQLWRALAETSEVEAMLALMSPTQLQAFLKRFRRRAGQIRR